MEDFREKRLPDHLLSMLRKKGDKKKRITSVSYHLSSDGLPFYSYPCCRAAGHPVIFSPLGKNYFSIPSSSTSNTSVENGLICAPVSLEP